MDLHEILCPQEEIPSQLVQSVFSFVDCPKYMDSAKLLGFNLGTTSFESLLDVTSKVRELSIGNGFQVTLTSSSSRRKKWVCKDMNKCPFEVTIFLKKNGKVYISTLQLNHNHHFYAKCADFDGKKRRNTAMGQSMVCLL